MKFYHTADIHLGVIPDVGFPWSESRAEEIYDSFVRLTAQANLEKVDLLLISGDLFHRQPLKRELRALNDLFEGLCNTEVVFITGNRDYLREDSSYRTFRFGRNVHLLDGVQKKKVVFPKLHTAVYGVSFQDQKPEQLTYENLKPEQDGLFSILLLHAGMDPGHVSLEVEKLEALGFDYVALGGDHEPKVYAENRIRCAGTLEPVRREDIGDHGFIEGNWQNNVLSTHFVSFALRNYHQVTLFSDRATTEDMLIGKLKEEIQRLGQRNFYRVEIRGVYAPGRRLVPEHFLESGNVVEFRDLSEPEFNLTELRKRHGRDIIGRYIDYFDQKDMDEQDKKALYIGLMALLEAER